MTHPKPLPGFRPRRVSHTTHPKVRAYSQARPRLKVYPNGIARPARRSPGQRLVTQDCTFGNARAPSAEARAKAGPPLHNINQYKTIPVLAGVGGGSSPYPFLNGWRQSPAQLRTAHTATLAHLTFIPFSLTFFPSHKPEQTPRSSLRSKCTPAPLANRPRRASNINHPHSYSRFPTS
jgi:hypothetical protein